MAISSTLVDRVKIFAESSGSGPFVLGNAVPAFRGAEALIDGLTYSYAVESGADYEAGQGVYVEAVNQLIRAPTISSANGGPVPFPANVSINFTALAADLLTRLEGSGTVTSVSGSGGTTGLTLTGGPIEIDGVLTLGGVLNVANGGTGGTDGPTARTGIGLGNVDNTSDANKPVSIAVQAFIDDLNGPGGSADVGFAQSGTGAVARTAQAKLRENVSVEDFYSGDFPDALEAASAVATTVHIHGAAYTVDRILTVAANTDIVMHGGTISRAGGYTGTHFITFAGNWSISGNGTFDGLGMTAPVASWAGVGVPPGSCIYAAGANIGSRVSTGRISAGIKFIRFPSGPVFVKWLKGLFVDGIELIGCQSATVQWKASGSYVNIPATTNAGTSSAPIGEIITSAGIEAYQCAVASVTNSRIPAISKGVSLSADLALSTGNVFTFATPRHCMEHLVSCARVISRGNSYDGGADRGDGYKIVICDSGISNGHIFVDNAYCGYIQDSDNLQLGPDTATGVTQRAYAFTNTSAAGGRAITNLSLQIGSLKGVSGSNVLYIQTDAGAIAAGYTMNFEIFGGTVRGFDSLVFNGTVNLGGILDYSWKGTAVNGTTGSLDLRVRNADIALTFKNCVSPLADVGSTVGGAGAAIDGSISVDVVALNCTGTAAPIRHAASAGAGYEGKFTDLKYSIRSSGCTFDKAFALSLGAADTIRMLNLDLICPDLDPNNSGSSGQAITFDANSKAFKARVRLNVLGLGNATPMNVTFTNAGSMTGVLEKPIAGSITGGALTAV